MAEDKADPFDNNTNPQHVLRNQGNKLAKRAAKMRDGDLMKQMKNGSLEAMKQDVIYTGALLGKCGIHLELFKGSMAQTELTIGEFLDSIRFVYREGIETENDWIGLLNEMQKLKDMAAEVVSAANSASALANKAEQDAYDSAAIFIAAIMQAKKEAEERERQILEEKERKRKEEEKLKEERRRKEEEERKKEEARLAELRRLEEIKLAKQREEERLRQEQLDKERLAKEAEEKAKKEARLKLEREKREAEAAKLKLKRDAEEAERKRKREAEEAEKARLALIEKQKREEEERKRQEKERKKKKVPTATLR